MMNRKKMVIFAMTALMAVSMIGCGKKTEDKKTDDTAKTQESESSKKTYDVSKYVKLGAYKNMDVTVEGTFEVTDDDVKDYINNVCNYYPEYEDSDKTQVESGDFVDIDYEGKKDGEAFDGGSAQGYVLEIGSNSFIDGFEDGLIGHEVGETVDLNLTFPEDYQNTDLAGADVVFTVKINKIKTKKDINYDNMTDEYVQSNLQTDSVDDLKKQVKEYLTSQNDSNKTSAERQAVLDKLVSESEVTLPDGLVDQRVDEYLQQLENQNCSDGTSLDDFIQKQYQMTTDEFTAKMKEQLEPTLEQELILEAVAKDMKLEIDEDKYQTFLNNAVSSGQAQSTDEYVKSYDNDYESGDSFLRNRFLLTQTLAELSDQCNFTYQETEKTDSEQ